MIVYQHTTEQLTQTMNQGIDLVLQKALEKGIIDEDKWSELIKLRIVATDQKNLFSKMICKFFGKENEITAHVVTLEK